MGTADLLLTGGVLGAASLKVAGRRLMSGDRSRGRSEVTITATDLAEVPVPTERSTGVART